MKTKVVLTLFPNRVRGYNWVFEQILRENIRQLDGRGFSDKRLKPPRAVM